MERRLLTPAEAVLLVAPVSGSATLCIQAGLLALMGAGRLGIEKGSRLTGPVLLLAPNPADAGQPLPGHLAALEQALLAYGKGRRLSSTQVVAALQRALGADYRRYVHDEVAASLVKRGLLARTDGRWLGLFPRIRYARTARGEAMAAPLVRLSSQLKGLPSLIGSDPGQAMRLARSAGVLLILAPDARKHIETLRKLFAAQGDQLGILAYMPLGDDKESRADPLLELGDMALTFEVSALLDAVADIGDFTSSGDSSSSDGGGDGGGGD